MFSTAWMNHNPGTQNPLSWKVIKDTTNPAGGLGYFTSLGFRHSTASVSLGSISLFVMSSSHA
jgi:hypothetical protein